MVQGPSLAALEALRDASASVDEQIAILRQLKNDIVGHQQRKELVVKQAAVEPLVRVVSAAGFIRRSPGAGDAGCWSTEDEARLQAILILGSLANGGAIFLQPLLAAGVHECLLSTLHATHNPKLLVAALQALHGLAEQSRTNVRCDNPVRIDVIDNRSLAVFDAVLRRQCSLPHYRTLFHLTNDIITASAIDETAKVKLFESAIWKPLLETFLYSTAGQQAFLDDKSDLISRGEAAKVISTIAAIIEGSDYRAECFIYDEVVRLALPYSCNMVNSGLLPAVEVAPIKHVNFCESSSSFPALASLQQNGGDKRLSRNVTASMSFDPTPAFEMCLYLVSLARSAPDHATLPTLRLLASVTNAISAHQYLVPHTLHFQQRLRQRDRFMAACAIPLAVQSIQRACEPSRNDGMSPAQQQDHRELKPEACEILASLIRSSKDLQVAAVDSGAIKRICPILKKTFDNVSSTKPMWVSRSSKRQDGEDSTPSACSLGSRGMSAEVGYAMRCRQAALEAIAALASKEDVHRQAIVQAGVITCIIDSLKPFSADTLEKTGKNGNQVTPKDGNTTQVIIAACHAAQSMSRSVSLLRTSLIDASIAKPISELLKHPTLEVRIAATDVCCNLVLEFSPMREDLLGAGVMKTLTEHARQSEMGLRLSSLWALKHLVLSATREIKVQTLEELGVGWLVAAVQGQGRAADGAVGGGVVINATGGLSAPNAAGERVDLLNPSSMDVDDPSANSAGFDEDEDGEVLYDEASLTHYRASHLRSTLNQTATSEQQTSFDSQRYLESIRDMEQNSTLRGRRDDVAVQEQCLDFMRNMLTGDDCAHMLDHLLHQIGSTKMFSILTEKLAALNLPSSSAFRNASASAPTANRPIYQPTELILSTIHFITHVANGSPQQKQLLIAQKPLLSAWLPHFHHPDSRVRCVSVWVVNNLTWIEDEHDRPAAQQRARELRSVGISGAVEGLRGDVDLDVRERVKVAVKQIESLG